MTTVTKKQMEDAFRDAVKDTSTCSVGKLLDSVDEDLSKMLKSKIADEVHYSAAVIVRVLKSLGLGTISPDMMNKHRKGLCRCVPTK